MTSQLNLANLITIARILLIPVFLVLLFAGPQEPYDDVAAAAIFVLAAATDKLDGCVARRRRQITTLGQFLDPLADKLLVAAALIGLAVQGRLAVWIAVVILGREMAVSVLRSVAVSQGVSIPADRYGKLKTVLQIVYIVYLLLPIAGILDFLGLSWVAPTPVEWGLTAAVVFVTLASGVRYFLNARDVVRLPGRSYR